MRAAHLYILAILLAVFSIPNFLSAEVLDPSEDQKPLLIAKANPALADVNCLYVEIALHPGFWPIDPNLLTARRLAQKAEAVLSSAGIISCEDINSSIIADIKKRHGSVSNLKIRKPGFPELRFDTGILPLVDANQFIIRVQVSLSKKLPLSRDSSSYVMADVWKHEPVVRLVSSAELPEALIATVLEQTRAFIVAQSVAKQSDVNRFGPEFAESSVEFYTKPIEPQDTNAAKEQVNEYKFVASKNSEVFHKPDCVFAEKIAKHNLVEYKTREEAIKSGKRPCKRCKP
jgi:hypothetical protein